MDASAALLLKALTDVIIHAVFTINRIKHMSEEEKSQAIMDAEETTNKLINIMKGL